MKRWSKVLALLLILSILLSTAVSASTLSTAQPLASDYIKSYSAYIYKVPGTMTLQIHFEIYATQPLTEIGAMRVTLQKSTDKINWSLAKYYSSLDYPNMIANNKISYSSFLQFTRESGYYYRAIVGFWGGMNGTGDLISYCTPYV